MPSWLARTAPPPTRSPPDPERDQTRHVFLESRFRLRLPSHPASRRRSCPWLVVGVISSTGDLHPRAADHAVRTRVAGTVARPGSHRTVRTLFVYGSSGRRVMTPAAGRFATSKSSPQRQLWQLGGDDVLVPIVAGAAFPALAIAFGAPARMAPSRSRVFLRVAPFGFSAVAIGRLSCTAVSSTGIAFPCPPVLDPARSAGITPAFRYYAILRLLLGHQPSSFRPPAYRQPAGTQQISLGETLRFRRDRVATTPSDPTTGIGHRRCEPARPSEERLTALHFRSPPRRIYGLLQTRPRGNPAARDQAALEPPGQFRAAPLPLRCWIPPVRAPGQDFTPPISTSVPSTPRPPLRGRLRWALSGWP